MLSFSVLWRIPPQASAAMHDLVPLLIAHGAILVFAFTLAARAGAPVPAAPLLVVAGGLTWDGRLSLALVMGISIVANVMGDALWYQAGRWRGHRVMKLLCQISLSPDTCVRQSEGILTRWGGSSLIAAKFLPGVSVVAAPMAGAMGMTWRRFLAFDVLASAIWSALYLVLGMLFARQIDRVLDVMSGTGKVAAIVVLAALALLLAGRWARRRWMTSERFAPRITVHELRELIRRGESPVVIDVRSQNPLFGDTQRVPGAIALTLAELPAAARSLPREREIVLYCNCPNEASAVRGARILAEHGVHRAKALKGGLEAWLAVESLSPLGLTAATGVVLGSEAG
jgi:membrane protein DedA with SNARE-associated domain/rhodanese-related sulfurtransferase